MRPLWYQVLLLHRYFEWLMMSWDIKELNKTYTLLKRLYYWKGLKPSVEKHIKMCHQCQRRNKQVVKYATLHFDVATFLVQFISMDLIGEFHPQLVENTDTP